MVKPGREFEEAVYSFAKTLDPTAEILFDHRAIDRDTGKPRQCDVWINAKFGGHWPLSILVSCKDHHRKLHVGDIGSFYDEVRSTGASTGVIYSRAEFTKPALDKAQASGLACCRIYQNEPADIPQIIQFDQFTCKPAGQLELETNLMATKYKTWNDLFGIIIRCDQDDQTALDVIAAIFEQGEEWSLQQLRQVCLDRARQSGHETVYLGVWEKNHRAIAFYHKYGFEIVGSHAFQLGDETQNDFWMERRLQEPAQ